MKGIKEFFGGLDSPTQDTFVQLLQDMTSTRPPDRIEEIRAELKKVSAEIDKVNGEREHLTSDRQKVSEVLKRVQDFLNANEKADIILKLLHNVLFMWVTELKSWIIEMKPTKLLDRKHRLNQELALLTQRSAIGAALQERLFENKNG